MDILISLIIVVLGITLLVLLYKFYNKRGLYFSTIISNILAFIMFFKIGTINNINVNLGILLFPLYFNILGIFLEKYSEKELNNIIKLSLYSNIFVSIMIFVMNCYIPAVTETISINIKATFIQNYRMLVIYPLALYLASILYKKLYYLTVNIKNKPFVAKLLSFIFISTLSTLLISMVTYYNTLKATEIITLIVSNYMIGLLYFLINLIITYKFVNKKVKK